MNLAKRLSNAVIIRRRFIASAAASVAAVAFLRGAVGQKRMGLVIHSWGRRWQGKHSSIKYPPFVTALDVLDHCMEIGAGGLQIGVDGWTSEFAGKVRDTRESYDLYLEGSISLPKGEEDVARFDKAIRSGKEAGATVFRSAAGGRRYELFSRLEDFKAFKQQTWRSMQLAAAVAQFARMSRLTLSKHELRSGLEAASSAGVVPSQIELGTALWASGNIVAAEKLFEQAVATDTTGLAALTIGDLFHHGSPAAKFPADAIRAAKEFTTACRQGQPTGLLRLNDSRTANLTPSTDTGLRDCVALADTPGSPLARMLEHSTAGMLMLAKLHRDNTLSGISKPERALYWTGKVAATGNPAARLELAKTLAWGIPDPAGKPQLPLDLDRAHAIFQRLIHDGRFTPSAPEKDSAIDALLELAILYERGTFGTGGVYEALSLLSKFPELSSTGRAHDYVAQLRQRYSTLEGLRKSALAPEDTLNIGDAKAPILITTMASWGCATCTDFFRRVLPDVEANYAKQGLARIEVRLKSPVKFGSLSAAVGSAMLCVPNEHRLTFYAAVFEGTAALMAMSEDDRRASIWRIAQSVPPGTTCSPDGTPPPAAPDWPSQFRPPGDSPSSLSANGNLLENRAQDAVRWGISDFPIVFVNGQRLENPDIETLRRTIYDFTRPQDRSALTKP